jgi:hypothetical protein
LPDKKWDLQVHPLKTIDVFVAGLPVAIRGLFYSQIALAFSRATVDWDYTAIAKEALQGGPTPGHALRAAMLCGLLDFAIERWISNPTGGHRAIQGPAEQKNNIKILLALAEPRKLSYMRLAHEQWKELRASTLSMKSIMQFETAELDAVLGDFGFE